VGTLSPQFGGAALGDSRQTRATTGAKLAPVILSRKRMVARNHDRIATRIATPWRAVPGIAGTLAAKL
jgi:hypothetical protein